MKQLSRLQKRAYMNSQPAIKEIKRKNFFSVERLELMRAFSQAGTKAYDAHFEATQRSVVDQLAPLEAQILDKLKSLNLTQDVIDNYIEVWADLNMWPRSKNASRKKLKALNKELGIC